MKKVILAVLLIASITEAKASENDYYINYFHNEEVGSIIYEEKTYLGATVFRISPYLEYKASRETTINNLAYLGSITKDLLYKATIQKMIWQTIHPDYIWSISQNGIDINTTPIENEINAKLKAYDRTSILDGNYYEVEYLKGLTLKDTTLDLSNYEISNFSAGLTNNNITFYSFDKVGLFEIEFKNKLNLINNYILANKFIFNPFKIYVKVQGTALTFDITSSPYYHDFTFDAYDLEGNYITTFNVSEENQTFYYQKGLELKLVERENSIYYPSNDIYVLEDGSFNHTVSIIEKPKTFKVEVITIDMDFLNDGPSEEGYSDISVYDENYHYVTGCKGEGSCFVYLNIGKYIFVDNITKQARSYIVCEDFPYEVNRYLIRGFITNNNIEIKSNDIDITPMGNGIYQFNQSLYPDVYTFIINKKSVEIDLTKYENYFYIEDFGLFYRLTNDNENVENNNSDINNSYNNDYQEKEIVINVPDTNISNVDWGYLYVKKKYYFYSNSNNYFN